MTKELHRDQVERVTADKPYIYGHGTHKVSLLDCGLKKNILVSLAKNDCTVTVYPCHTTAAEMLADNPDGIFLSPGPGDPLDVPYVISTVKELIGKNRFSASALVYRCFLWHWERILLSCLSGTADQIIR